MTSTRIGDGHEPPSIDGCRDAATLAEDTVTRKQPRIAIGLGIVRGQQLVAPETALRWVVPQTAGYGLCLRRDDADGPKREASADSSGSAPIAYHEQSLRLTGNVATL